MLDFYELRKGGEYAWHELETVGIGFATSEEAGRFVDTVMEELEVRIGEEISKCATEEELKEFDQSKTIEEAGRWLARHCPNYGEIVVEKQSEMEAELRKAAPYIKGNLIPQAGEEMRNIIIFE